MFEQQSSKLRPGLSTLGSLDSKHPGDRQCLPIASQVFSSEVKRTKSSLAGDPNCVPGRNRRNINSNLVQFTEEMSSWFLLKVNGIYLGNVARWMGWERKLPKSLYTEEVLCLSSLMANRLVFAFSLPGNLCYYSAACPLFP